MSVISLYIQENVFTYDFYFVVEMNIVPAAKGIK